jgi:hypothetical protein
LSSPRASIGDPAFQAFTNWIPDYDLGNDRQGNQAANENESGNEMPFQPAEFKPDLIHDFNTHDRGAKSFLPGAKSARYFL